MHSYSYQTFNGVYSSQSQGLAYPQSLYELQDIVKNSSLKIRTSGSNHTFNEISLTDELTLRTNYLNRILDISNSTITVESGAIIDNINQVLAQYNLSLPVEAATSLQSAGGVISTGTHGSMFCPNLSGQNCGSFSNAVESLTLVLENGEIRTFDFRDGDYFRAAKCSLGCLGAIYDITFKCEPMYGIEERTVNIDWNTFIRDLNELLIDYPLTQAYVNPDLQTTVTLRRKIPWKEGMEYGYKMLTSNKQPPYYIESEMGVPIELLNEALLYTVQSIPTDILIRFCGADDTLLSMESGRPTAFISMSFGKEVDPSVAINTLKRISNELVNRFGARPHYGKINNLTSNQMAQIYGDNFYKFKRIKNELSPTGKFDNGYILRLFGPNTNMWQ